MVIAEFQLEFSYYQFMVYDSKIVLLGNDWTDDHFSQGFSRKDSSICFVTLLQFGYGQVQVFDSDYVFDKRDERAIKCPFYCPSGKVFIEGPEENEAHAVDLEPGHYQLTEAQQANYDEETLLIRLYFVKVETPAIKSEIVVKDEQLNPMYPLLESSEIASF